MNNQTINILLMQWADKIPKDSIHTLSKELQNIPEDKTHLFNTIALKNPAMGLLLSLVLGGLGVDRFYKGDMGLGITKLAMIAIPLLFLITLDFFLSFSPDLCRLLGASFIFLPIWLLVTFLDIFLICNGIKADNLEKIQNLIKTL